MRNILAAVILIGFTVAGVAQGLITPIGPGGISLLGPAVLVGAGPTVLAPQFRNPTTTDDAAHGATVGMLWLNITTGAIYKATSVSNGAAVWALQTLSASLPLDGLASTNVSAAYSFNLLRAAYAGNCCIITRLSDSTTLTLGFTGNSVNVSGVAAFLSGTSGVLTTWYDQQNSNNATQGTLADAPIFSLDLNGNPQLSFNQGSTQYLNLPSGVAITNPNLSITVVGSPQRLYTGGAIVNLGPNSSNEFVLENFGNTGTYKIPAILASDPFGALGNTPAENGPNVQGVTQNSANGADVFENETTTNSAATGSTQAFTGGQIGTETLFNGEMAGTVSTVILHTVKLTGAQRTDLYQRLYRQNNIALQRAMNNLVVVGDSIVSGSIGNAFFSWAYYANQQATVSARMVNIGVPGQTAAQGVTNYSAYTAPQFVSAARRNVLIIAWGTDDLFAGSTAASVWTSLQSVIASAVSSGFRPLVATVLPLGTIYETQRIALNTLIKNGYVAAGAYGLIDLASSPVMGQAGQNTNTTYYNADGVHPNTFGHQTLYPIVTPVLNPALLNFLLKRDLDPGSNDNNPMWLEKAA